MGISEDEGSNEAEQVESIISTIMDENNVKFDIIGRIGIKGAKMRPLRIKVDDNGHRRMILRKAKQLKEIKDFERIYIAPDLTRKQQEEDKVKRDEVKKLRLEGNASARIERGIVVSN